LREGGGRSEILCKKAGSKEKNFTGGKGYLKRIHTPHEEEKGKEGGGKVCDLVIEDKGGKVNITQGK